MWKTITNHQNYAVSDRGEVINKRNNYQLNIRVKNDYCFVGISTLTGKKWFSLHRLVAKAFVPNPFNKPEVNHKDGNKLNCHYSNLEWSTRLENNRHAIRIGLHDPHSINTRPVYQYTMQGEFLKEWKSGRYAARELGISEVTISRTAQGKDGRTQTGGFRWAFKDRVLPVQI